MSKQKPAYVCGSKRTGYTLKLNNAAQALGYGPLLEVTFPVYRAAQSIANTITAAVAASQAAHNA